MYKAVLFDLFGTLIESPSMTAYRQMIADVAEILGQLFETFEEPWMSINDGRLDGSFGSSEGDIVAAAELVGTSVSESQMAQCMEVRRSAVREFMTPKPGVVEMLDELGDMGCALGLVTDCVYDVPAVWDETKFAGYFSAKYFSCVSHVRKPGARTYLGVLAALDVRPQDALFVGDGGSDELNGAVRAGIDAVKIDDIPDASEARLRVGVSEWDGPTATSMSDIAGYVRGER
jgi:putative hydrolase of the HAD superfamily